MKAPGTLKGSREDMEWIGCYLEINMEEMGRRFGISSV
jgi:hypothetical protein